MEKILTFIENHGIAIVVTAIVIYFLYRFGKIELDYWQAKRKISVTNYDDVMDKVLKVTPEVKGVMKEILLQTHCSRVHISQFHNGTEGFGGQPFIYMSNTYEVTDGTAPSQYHARQKMPFTLYDSLVRNIILHDTIVIDPRNRIDDFDGMVYETVEQRGNVMSICTKLVDENKKAIGYLGIDYCATDDFPFNPDGIERVRRILFREAQTISTLLYVRVSQETQITKRS